MIKEVTQLAKLYLNDDVSVLSRNVLSCYGHYQEVSYEKQGCASPVMPILVLDSSFYSIFATFFYFSNILT